MTDKSPSSSVTTDMEENSLMNSWSELLKNHKREDEMSQWEWWNK